MNTDLEAWRKICDSCHSELLLRPDPSRPGAWLFRRDSPSGSVWYCGVERGDGAVEVTTVAKKTEATAWARKLGYRLVQRWPPPLPAEGEAPAHELHQTPAPPAIVDHAARCGPNCPYRQLIPQG